MEKIRCFSELRIDLGTNAYIHIEESTDGIWNISLCSPNNLRIGVPNNDGIHYRFVKEVFGMPL